MFSPGTKVYIGAGYWGMGGRNIHVVGLRRISRDLVNSGVHIGAIGHFRVKSIYSEKRWSNLKHLEAELFSNREDANAYLEWILSANKRERPAKLNTNSASDPKDI